VRGRAFAWFGGSALGVAVVYYCVLTLTRLVHYLSCYTL